MFSRRIPLPDLIDLCRVLRHQLAAGLSIGRILQQQSSRGRPSVRAIAARVEESLRKGDHLSDAFDAEAACFPPIFLAMVKVGETTGHLAEIFGELEKYFQLELHLRRQFRAQTFLPLVQFVFAVCIVAGVIFLLGMIADMNNAAPLLTIFGLKGGPAALAFLAMIFGTLGIGVLGYWLLSSVGSRQLWFHRFLMRVPMLGPCLYSLAMSRFTLALQLTLDSGLSITKGIRLSFEATGNAVFVDGADAVVSSLKKGESLHDSLGRFRLLDEGFLEMVFSAEASGSVPEMMRHLARQYQEETSRRMTTLTRFAAGAVWLFVAMFIVWAIFRLAMVYLDALTGKM